MFKLLHGKFVVRNGLQPDGDTIRFKPDNVDFVEELRRESHGSTIMNEGVNIRLEAVDALEKSQELTGATAARDELLRRLGFTDVRFSGNPPFTINSGDQEISGHVLSNGFDNFGRLIGFVYEGDGSSTAARIAKKGVWLRSKGFPGDPLIVETPILANLRKAVLWPKLYRRLEKYLESGRRENLDGFIRWLQEDPQSRDDGILLIQSNPPESVRLHNVVDVSGSSVELKFWPEEFIIQGHPTNPNGSRP
ncbi:hypothetical protein DER46DRAFT_560402 [Fusarium sp. MPI-SDFR-AT-0072]|nr:hypothetical protein DER46DRAFT_560402 [Fusarium sp. MPI-SDFR-AT-0072]